MARLPRTARTLCSAAMAHTPETLFRRFDELGIPYQNHSHPPLFTVADSKALRGQLPGGHCKSLFLKDKRGALHLLVASEDRAVDLKQLKKRLGVGNLSFASPDLLHEVLGVRPGAVTPFGLINDIGNRVHVMLDKGMLAHDPLNYHPLVNDQTTSIAPRDLIAFIESCGHAPEVIDLDLDYDPAAPAA